MLAAKADLREQVWGRLAAARLSRFPGAHGRIPNVTGAEAAAERLRGLDVWAAASALKANPDAPQWPVRQRALEDGIVVYMAVPRLADERPFFLLDPDRLADTPRRSSSIAGANRSAVTVDVDDLGPVDLVVTGSVAVSPDGARLGKGGGFADLEFAVASAAGLIGPDTPVVTTVHPAQILEPGVIPVTGHDVGVDLIVTPDEVIEVVRDAPRPAARIHWDELTEDKVAAIPLLRRLRDGG